MVYSETSFDVLIGGIIQAEKGYSNDALDSSSTLDIIKCDVG